MTKELVSFQQTSKQGDLARGLGSLPLLIHILFDWQRRLSDKRRYGRRRSNGLAGREAVVKYPIVADRLFSLLVLKTLQNANRSTGEYKPGIGGCVMDRSSAGQLDGADQFDTLRKALVPTGPQQSGKRVCQSTLHEPVLNELLRVLDPSPAPLV